MGPKISVDSATMMNKGLEYIEACWLFSAEPAQIDIVVHPQSIIHSMVQYRDGSILAQLGQPDMKTPIAYGLGFPERIDATVEALDFTQISALQFETADYEKFPALALARQAMKTGGTAPAILNAANEIAVDAFLKGSLPFLSITDVVEDTLDALDSESATDLEVILNADQEARRIANEAITGKLA
jgi:1-deoxy-D-xylulose-5-phosphate reductoisomerase